VTPFNDDGFTPWNELSTGEKAARATQQSFNFGFVVVGLVLTVGDLFARQGRRVDTFARAELVMSCGPRSFRPTARSPTSTGQWTRSRRIIAACSCWATPRRF
jgi:import inner membrane translocase subunit TIM21